MFTVEIVRLSGPVGSLIVTPCFGYNVTVTVSNTPDTAVMSVS